MRKIKINENKLVGKFKLPLLEHKVVNNLLGFQKKINLNKLYNLYSKVVTLTNETCNSDIKDLNINIKLKDVTVRDLEGLVAYVSDKNLRKNKVVNYTISYKTTDDKFGITLCPNKVSYTTLIKTDTTITLVFVQPLKKVYCFDDVKKYNTLMKMIKKI